MSDSVWCQRCGQENPPSAYSCSKCKRRLRPPSPEEQALMEISQQVSAPPREGSVLGMLVALLGGLGVLAPAVWVAVTLADIGEYRDLSAIQITQLYTQGALWVLVAIGILLAGLLWVASTRD